MSTIKTDLDRGIFSITLNRPQVRNAFNDQLIADLTSAFEKIECEDDIRAVVLKGDGPIFCAGGDLNWMQKSIGLSVEENLQDTHRLSQLFALMNRCPKPLVGLVQGAAIGGGVGLVSVCDYVVAHRNTVFSLSEVRLGIVPACIGPFVMAKIGESHARAYFISAERFSAERALEIGLVHENVDSESALWQAGDRILQNLLQCGPQAMSKAKSLIATIKTQSFEENLDYVSRMLAELRVSPEGQEGLKAFLEKRKPSWNLP